MIQRSLEDFLKANAEEREAMIDETATQLHLARQFIRFDKAASVCKNEAARKQLEKYKQEIIKLMERQRV